MYYINDSITSITTILSQKPKAKTDLTALQLLLKLHKN